MALITLISPAKTQNFDPVSLAVSTSEVRFQQETQALVHLLKKYNSEKLGSLMDISQDLAELNVERYAAFSASYTEKNAKPALFAFEGDVYKSMDKRAYTKQQLTYAQNHLRILSGLYGLLRPLDKIQPYRLEMKTALPNKAGKNLYQFWGDKLTQLLNQDIANNNIKAVINLASNEYSKALKPKALQAEVITPQFKEFKEGKLRTVAIFAKQARGAMADFIIKNQPKTAKELKIFNEMGYEYNEGASKANEWVFSR